MLRRPWLVVLTLVALLAACGSDPAEQVQSDDDDGSDVEQVPREVNSAYLAQAAEDTLEAGTGRMEMTMAFTGDVDGTALDSSVTMTGEYDNTIPASHVIMDMGSLMQEMVDAAEAAGEDTEGADGLLGQDFTFESIQVGGQIYARASMFGMLGSLMGDDAPDLADKWIVSDVTEMNGQDVGALGGGSLMGVDPSTYLELLEGAGGEVEDLGTSEVRGVETTGHRVDISFGDALAAQADEDAAAELADELDRLGTEALDDLTMTTEIYVDADGRIRRIVMDMGFADMAGAVPELGSGLGNATMTVDYFDFGADDIEVSAPPAEDVLTEDALNDLLGVPGSFESPTTI